MSKSVNMERLIQNLDNRLENNSFVNNGSQKYLPLTNNINDIVDSNFSYLNNNNTVQQKPKNLVLETPKKIEVEVKKTNYFSICKKYILIYFIFVILSHPEFDYITNIDEMNKLYKIMIKGIVFIIILLIINVSI